MNKLNVQYCLLLVDDSPTNLAILAAGLTDSLVIFPRCFT